MSKFWQIPRRTFLRGIGAALALPYLEMMRGTAAAAGGGAAPGRLACIFLPNGVYPKAWDVKGAGREFAFSPILEPLAEFKKDLTIVSNLNNCGKGHVQLTSAFLTGRAIDHGKNGVSLDQRIARRIGNSTRLQSIVLGTEPPRQGLAGEDPIACANTVSWSSPTTRVSPEINPAVAFDRLFRSFDSPEARRAAEDRLSVVDAVLEDAKALSRRAGSADKQKIDEYLSGVRQVEQGVERLLAPPARDWTPPTTPDLKRPADGIPRSYPEHLRLMMDLLVLALQTDSTRVATLMTAHGFSRQNYSFLSSVASDHHGMSHHKNQPKAVDEYTRVSRWHMEQLAYLLGRMQAVNEGEGTLLDNTLLLYGSDMKDGNGHVPVNLPVLLAGSGGGILKPAGHVSCDANTPLANLHLTLCHKFGVEADDFNEASTGTLSHLI